MFNEKIIQYAITFTLWVQTLWNQANAGLINSFPKIPRMQSKNMMVLKISVSQSKKTTLLNNIDKWEKDNICQTIWDKSEVLLGMC
jgi:hypothetical protein